MRFNHPFASALALLASMAAPSMSQYNPNCHYFVMYTGGSLVIERVDPLLSPGVASNHVHMITGGNAFNANANYDTQSSTCTTMPVKQDKSAYWMPSLYAYYKGQYTRVPEAYNRKIYYKYGNRDCSYDNSITAFPPGFRMITGSATQRVADATMMGVGGNTLQWICHDGSANPPQATGFPTGFQSCNDPDSPGLAASMRFPSCWNGQNFNAADPLAHMAFPTQADGMAGCPASHNAARFPEIFIETYFDVSQFDDIQKDYSDPDNGPWVLADGDPTGYSYHMDFIQGWEDGALATAMPNCAISDGSSDVGVGLGSAACFGTGYQASAAQNQCRLGSIVTPAENVGVTGTGAQGEAGGSVGSALPGCNPIQTTQPAVIHDPSTCGAPTAVEGGSPPPAGGATDGAGGNNSSSGAAASTSVPPAQSSTPSTTGIGPGNNYQQKDAVVPSSIPGSLSASPQEAAISISSSPTNTPSSDTTPSTGSGSPASISVKSSRGTATWTYQGCYTDLTPSRDTRSLANWGSGTSSTTCANNCFTAGYAIAGTENGGQCFCGDVMTSTTKQADSECNMACSGASGEVCGGSDRLSVYAQAGTKLTKRSKRSHRHVVRHESF